MNTPVQMQDAAGNFIQVDASIDPNFGIPPSINPALLDPNTGQLLPQDVPTVQQTGIGMFGVIMLGVGALIFYHHFYKGKKRVPR